MTQFDPFLPKSVERYVEPFVGGGAVYFHLKASLPTMRAALFDINDEIINAFSVVRDNHSALMNRLDEHLASYQKDPKGYYYTVRSQHGIKNAIARAARVIFLNKTCFNGLWRVNASGEFNVPIGSFRKVTLYDRENLVAASRALKGTLIKRQDFRETLQKARKGEFVYVDPPYHPLSRTSAFTAYTKDDFGEKEQLALAELFFEADRRGVLLMLSNSDTSFIRNLYRRFEIRSVRARRAINCRGEGRGIVSELVVTNYLGS